MSSSSSVHSQAEFVNLQRLLPSKFFASSISKDLTQVLNMLADVKTHPW